MKTNKFSRTFDEGARKKITKTFLKNATNYYPHAQKIFFTVGGCE